MDYVRITLIAMRSSHCLGGFFWNPLGTRDYAQNVSLHDRDIPRAAVRVLLARLCLVLSVRDSSSDFWQRLRHDDLQLDRQC